MALPLTVQSRRIVAARSLRGLTQVQVGQKLEAEGVGKHDAARIEREEDDAPQLSPSRRAALSRVLGVPDWWWTLEDADFYERLAGTEDVREQLDRHEHLLREITARLPMAGDQTAPTPLPEAEPRSGNEDSAPPGQTPKRQDA